MKRWLFNFAVGMSLVLCMATVALWVRGYAVSDILNYSTLTWGFDLRSGIGKVVFELSTGQLAMKYPFLWLHDSYSEQRRRNWSREDGIWGFHLRTIVQSGTTFRQVTVPHWFLAALFAITPTLWLVN